MDTQRLEAGDFLVALLKVANDAARDSGYALAGKKVAISPSGESWKVYYAVIPPPGKGVLGGDFTVMIDPDKLDVERIEKGR